LFVRCACRALSETLRNGNAAPPRVVTIISAMHILLIEDDVRAAEYLVKGLDECGHVVDHAFDGEDGLHLALTGHYDVIVADRLLPKRDGLSVVRMMRADHNTTPVLVLSALGEVDDRVAGLRAGGDDYRVKPYVAPEQPLQVGDLLLDPRKQTVKRADKLIRLQPREFRLLECLMRHSGQVLTRTMLLEQVWDFHFDPQTNVIDVQISRLRGKIDKGFDVCLLHTVRGAGYKLSETP
jgi:two-component system OmpR family response regulator